MSKVPELTSEREWEALCMGEVRGGRTRTPGEQLGLWGRRATGATLCEPRWFYAGERRHSSSEPGRRDPRTGASQRRLVRTPGMRQRPRLARGGCAQAQVTSSKSKTVSWDTDQREIALRVGVEYPRTLRVCRARRVGLWQTWGPRPLPRGEQPQPGQPQRELRPRTSCVL